MCDSETKSRKINDEFKNTFINWEISWLIDRSEQIVMKLNNYFFFNNERENNGEILMKEKKKEKWTIGIVKIEKLMKEKKSFKVKNKKKIKWHSSIERSVNGFEK